MPSFDYYVTTRECAEALLGDGLSNAAADDRIRALILELLRDAVQIDIAVLRSPNASAAAHRSAALTGMDLFAKRSDCYFARLSAATEQPRNAYLEIFVNPRLLEGEEITVEDFLGDGFDLTTRSGTVCGDALLNVERKAFVYALTCPPYPIQHTEQLLAATLGTLFMWFEKPTTVYRWNNDWSNYFDAGKEWWGTFFWTIAIPELERIVVVGASTTD